MKIFDFWYKLNLPDFEKIYGLKYAEGIYFGKGIDSSFRVFIENCDKKKYKINNFKFIKIDYFEKLVFSNINLKKIFYFEIKKEAGLNSIKEFCEFLDILFSKNKTFNSDDLINCLHQWQIITSQIKLDRNEYIGAWGEIWFLKELLNYDFGNVDHLLYVIKSWENENSRALKDFAFSENNLEIEVKSFAGDVRVHKFFTMAQLISTPNYKSYIASICLIENEMGKSLDDLIIELFECIKPLNNSELEAELRWKLKFRGCFDLIQVFEKLKYSVDLINPVLYFEMALVNKPLIDENITEVSWSTNFENIKFTHDNSDWIIYELNNRYC